MRVGADATFGWLEVELIGEMLAERHPGVDPLGVRFTDLKARVMALPGFREEPGHPCNEKILEHIQAAWTGARSEGPRSEPDDE